MSNPIISQSEVRNLQMRGGSLFRRNKSSGQARIQVSAKADRTNADGIVFHSKAEMRFSGELELQKRAGIITSYRRQVPFELKSASGKRICKYVCDFEATYPDGKVVYFEVKGSETEIWKLHYKWVKADYPGIDLRVVRPAERP
jgi:hypothetical protein